MRFGLLVLPDAPYPELVERWRLAESLGLDAIYLADHSGDYRDLRHHWFEATTTLAVLASTTSRVRIGTLVSNPVLRAPVLLAKEAVAVDHLSGGRLDLGIGTGIAPFDHAAMGIEYWTPQGRLARYAEYVRVVDGLLTSTDQGFEFEGEYFRTQSVAMVPPPVQRPRPPLTFGGQSPTVRRLAARYADCWNTHGRFGATYAEILTSTESQNAELDEACRRAGRRPDDVRRAVLLFAALDVWQGATGLERTVIDFRSVGVEEFVLLWPPPGRQRELERIATDLMPLLR